MRAKRLVFRLIAAWPGLLWRLRRGTPPTVATTERAPHLIAVSLRAHRLYLYERGALQSSYHVGVGGWRAHTPKGRFRVESKARDPSWWVPDVPSRYGELAGRTIPSDDPRHRIGPAWMQIHDGIGIHGKRPGPFGIGATNGCLALAWPDLIELYARVEVGTPVIIE